MFLALIYNFDEMEVYMSVRGIFQKSFEHDNKNKEPCCVSGSSLESAIDRNHGCSVLDLSLSEFDSVFQMDVSYNSLGIERKNCFFCKTMKC